MSWKIRLMKSVLLFSKEFNSKKDFNLYKKSQKLPMVTFSSSVQPVRANDD